MKKKYNLTRLGNQENQNDKKCLNIRNYYEGNKLKKIEFILNGFIQHINQKY